MTAKKLFKAYDDGTFWFEDYLKKNGAVSVALMTRNSETKEKELVQQITLDGRTQKVTIQSTNPEEPTLIMSFEGYLKKIKETFYPIFKEQVEELKEYAPLNERDNKKNNEN